MSLLNPARQRAIKHLSWRLVPGALCAAVATAYLVLAVVETAVARGLWWPFALVVFALAWLNWVALRD